MKYLLIVSWIFLPARYSHYQGTRVTQYERHAVVEPLPDPRRVTRVRSWQRTTIYGRGGYSTYLKETR